MGGKGVTGSDLFSLKIGNRRDWMVENMDEGRPVSYKAVRVILAPNSLV